MIFNWSIFTEPPPAKKKDTVCKQAAKFAPSEEKLSAGRKAMSFGKFFRLSWGMKLFDSLGNNFIMHLRSIHVRLDPGVCLQPARWFSYFIIYCLLTLANLVSPFYPTSTFEGGCHGPSWSSVSTWNDMHSSGDIELLGIERKWEWLVTYERQDGGRERE